jgi:hypothetical protein
MNTMEERVAKFVGKDAEEFERYDSRPLTEAERKSLQNAHSIYKKFCNKNP